jgi:hypothetical protein
LLFFTPAFQEQGHLKGLPPLVPTLKNRVSGFTYGDIVRFPFTKFFHHRAGGNAIKIQNSGVMG